MPEYNYGFNAPLKNAIDYLHWEWQYKPVGLVSYGGVSGGTRAAQMIKQVVTTLKMVPIPKPSRSPSSASSSTTRAPSRLTRSWKRRPRRC